MKMSDYFGGRVTFIHGGHDGVVFYETDQAYSEFDDDEQDQAAIHAINQHDKLIDALTDMIMQFERDGQPGYEYVLIEKAKRLVEEE